MRPMTEPLHESWQPAARAPRRSVAGRPAFPQPLRTAAPVLCCLLALFAVPLAANERIALVIGNSGYDDLGRLANAANDAELMALTLEEVAFNVIKAIDADRDAMADAIEEFGMRLESAGPDATGLFYYAGHGVQFNSVNYLVPVASGIEEATQLDTRALSAQQVLDRMELAANRLNIVILDACRDNPLPASSRSLSRGLARMNPPSGTLIAFSTENNMTALDGVPGEAHSPYAISLAARIKSPGLRLVDVFRRVGADVEEATGGQQRPLFEDRVRGDPFFFLAGDPAERPQIPNEPSAPVEPVLAASSRIAALLDLAERSLSENRLTTPAGDSAYYYYQQVLAVDPTDTDAHAGIGRVAEAYVSLARGAIRNGDRENAQRFLNILVSLSPGHEEIVRLRGEIEGVSRRAAGTGETASAGAAPSDAEGRLWFEVRDQCDSRELRRYIEEYPGGRYAEQAWAKLAACQLQ